MSIVKPRDGAPPPEMMKRAGTDGKLGTTRAIEAAVSMVSVAAPSATE